MHLIQMHLDGLNNIRRRIFATNRIWRYKPNKRIEIHIQRIRKMEKLHIILKALRCKTNLENKNIIRIFPQFF